MRKPAPLALLMLAGLAAVTFAPTATALCAVDDQGGCSAPRHDLLLTVRACPDDAAKVCVVGAEGVDVQTVFSGVNNLTVRNELPVAIDLQALVIARLDDARADDGSGPRVRADPIAALSVPAGQSVTQDVTIDGDAATVRFQALTADQREGELDAEVLHVMTMAGGIEDHPADPEAEELADDSAPVVDSGAPASKDAPYLGLVAVVGLLAAIAGLRRDD